MTFAFVDHLGAAMGAAVEQHVHVAISVPRHDDWLAAKLRGDVVARTRHLARMAYIEPGSAKDALHFQFEEVGVRVHAPVNTARLYKLCDVFDVSVAHAASPRSVHPSSLF